MNFQSALKIVCLVLSFAAASNGLSIDLAKLKAMRANGAAGLAGGQDYDPSAEKLYGKIAAGMSEDDYMSSFGDRTGQSFSEIDKSIDEKTYILGSNDELVIYIWGTLNESINATVDNEGTLVIPSVGTLPIGGLTLLAAKDVIKNKILEVYKDATITVVLGKVRKFRAYILGEVKHPGGFIINGATRVSDLIDLAGGISKPDSSRMRAIEIVNDKSETRIADMVLFYKNNDISKNPYLSEGDRVFISRRRETTSVFGEIAYPGTYDFVEGDFLSTLIMAAGGLNKNADSSKITITRYQDNPGFSENIITSSAESETFALKKDDMVLISRKTNCIIQNNVWVTGEVVSPGKYPITNNNSSLSSVIEMAGGFTEDALLGQSSLFRKKRHMKRDDEFDVLEGVPFSSLSPVEKGFMRAKYTGKDGMFSIDFNKLFNNNENIFNVTLRDGDSIFISRKNISVEVSGAVTRPGLVSFKQGEDIKYYINEAGGYNKRAKKFQTMLIRGSSGVWLRPTEAEEINDGDIILVPEREYKEFTKVARDVLVILSSIAAVITAYIAVSNSLND